MKIPRADVLLKRLQRQKDDEKAGVELEKERAELEKLKLENEKLRASLERDRVSFHREKIQWALDIVEKIQPDLDGTARIDYAMRLLKPLEVLAKSDLEIVDYSLPSLPSPRPLGLVDNIDKSRKSQSLS